MDKSRVIILRQIKYSETSVILQTYSEKEGKMSFIAKGVRGKKGKLRTAQFTPLNLLEICYKRTKTNQLSQVTDVKILEPFSRLFFNPIKRSIMMFMSELIEQSIKEKEPNQKLFEFLYSSVHWLDLTKNSCTHFHLLFMMRLTKYLGFYPMLSPCKEDNYFDLQQGVFATQKPQHKDFMGPRELPAWTQLIKCKLEMSHRLSFSKILKRKLLNGLMGYYKLHLSQFKELNSHKILQIIFDD